jgi:hypothetical protein
MSARDTIDFTDAHRPSFFSLIGFPTASIQIDNSSGQKE